MSLIQALSTAMSGLTAAQTGLTVTAGNIANAGTPGYVAKTALQVATTGGNASDGVRIEAINRELDRFVQQQLRTETSGGAFADLRASFFQQLQQTYGQPGSNASFDALFNGLTGAVQALSTSPDSSSARAAVLSSAQALAGQLNSMTAGIQSLRGQADQGIAADVDLANRALAQIADVNRQIAADPASDSAAAALADQRDQAIAQLAKLIDIRVVTGDNNQVSVFTASGYQLAGTQASQLAFTPRGSVTASEQWSADPNQRTLDSIRLISPSGDATDLLANGAIRSGELAAYVGMRDQTLVEAQQQVDGFAAQLARALSDQTTPGTPVTSGGQSGFTLDTANLLPGNTISLAFTDATNTPHNVTIVRVDDPGALPLPGSSDPNTTVIGVNFSGGMGAVVSQLNAALDSQGLQFSNPSGTVLQVLNAGPGTTVTSAAATATVTTLASGSPQLPLFTDGNAPFTGAITASGNQAIGFAGRIAVNAAVLADPSKLVMFQTAPPTPSGDATRPNFIWNQLAGALIDFPPSSGLGSANVPFHGTLGAFASQVISQQSQAANSADNLKQGQDIIVNALQQRFQRASGVDIDTEMSHLIALQTTYGANARVLTTVKQMMDTLLQM
jgi:flagellar hook-associated protein 1 FlgK